MIRREIKSFGHAIRGLKFLFQSQTHFRFHLAATLFVIAGASLMDVGRTDWLILLLCCALVLGMEALNSALEAALDRLHPERHPVIGKAKDMAAAAVLICSILAAVIGVMVFWPYLFPV